MNSFILEAEHLAMFCFINFCSSYKLVFENYIWKTKYTGQMKIFSSFPNLCCVYYSVFRILMDFLGSQLTVKEWVSLKPNLTHKNPNSSNIAVGSQKRKHLPSWGQNIFNVDIVSHWIYPSALLFKSYQMRNQGLGFPKWLSNNLPKTHNQS